MWLKSVSGPSWLLNQAERSSMSSSLSVRDNLALPLRELTRKELA